jgi:hypothetical protein
VDGSAEFASAEGREVTPLSEFAANALTYAQRGIEGVAAMVLLYIFVRCILERRKRK